MFLQPQSSNRRKLNTPISFIRKNFGSFLFRLRLFQLSPLWVYWSHRRARAEDRRLETVPGDGQNISADFKLLPDREALLALLPANGVCAEIGVATGDFSAKILKYCCVRELHLIDIWRGPFTLSGKVGGEAGYRQVQQKFQKEIESGKVRLYRGCSFERLAEMPDAYFDWVYIDASHRYCDIARDLAVAGRKVKPSGMICGHDYTRWGAYGLLRFGVVEAVNEFCAAEGWKLVCLTNERHRHISYVLRKQ